MEDFFRSLNDFFDCTAGAVLEHGGEILSYLGDAVTRGEPPLEFGMTDDDQEGEVRP